MTFGHQIALSRGILIEGPSGIGKTAFMNYLAYAYAGDSTVRGAFDLPVFIRLRQYQDLDPEEVFRQHLRGYGQIQDDGLTAELLRQGKLLFIVDGLNEVSEATRSKWAAFLGAYASSHAFVFSSQLRYPSFDQLRVMPLVPLTPDQARALLCERSGLDRSFIIQLPVATIALATNPQNLETLARVLRIDEAPPTSEHQLYAAVLAPVRQRWDDRGHHSYYAALQRAALLRLQLRPSDLRALPDQVVTDLINVKLLAEQGAGLEFVHDRLAAFLVADLLMEHPRAIEEGDWTASANWQTVIEIVAAVASSEQTMNLAGALLRIDTPQALNLAQRLVALFERRDDFVSSSWGTAFDVDVARAQRRFVAL